MLEIHFTFKAETHTCYRFESGEGSDAVTLYLKKTQIHTAGIDPKKGINVTVKEGRQ
jgi:hypothetical protein